MKKGHIFKKQNLNSGFLNDLNKKYKNKLV